VKLYTYFRSTAAYRVRIALNLKGLSAQLLPVNLVEKQHKDAAYTDLNPQGLIPALLLDSGAVLNQSMAILEYLEERHPQNRLLPSDALERAWVRSFAYEIACDLHPLNNLRVLKYLENELHVDAQGKQTWYEHWIKVGLGALEQRLKMRSPSQQGHYCFGDAVSMADCLLVPQVYNAERFNCDMQAYPLILQINQRCLRLDAFDKARPERQPDAPPV
jgi:maleylpyruvate isomerase